MKRVRLLLAILAMALAVAAAAVGTAAPRGHTAAKAPLFKPPSGC